MSVQAGRLPATMAPLAFTALTTALMGSYRVGATMMAAFIVGELVGAVPAGRLLDSIGANRGLRLLLLASAGLLVGLGSAVRFGSHPSLALGMVVVCGITVGGLSGGFRSMLAETVADRQLTRAISIDAMLMDGTIIAGPALVALLVSLDPAAPLFAMATAFLISAVLVRSGAELKPPNPNRARATSMPWRQAACWLGCLFAIGHLLSAVEVAALPLAERLGGGEGAAALLIGVLSGASIVGSALFAWRGNPAMWPAIGCLAGFALGGVVVTIDLGWTGIVAGLMIVGVCTGPLLSISSVRLQRILPESRKSSGFSIAYVVQSVGFGLGSLTLAVLPLTAAVLSGVLSALLVAFVLLLRVRSTPSRLDRKDR